MDASPEPVTRLFLTPQPLIAAINPLAVLHLLRTRLVGLAEQGQRFLILPQVKSQACQIAQGGTMSRVNLKRLEVVVPRLDQRLVFLKSEADEGEHLGVVRVQLDVAGEVLNSLFHLLDVKVEDLPDPVDGVEVEGLYLQCITVIPNCSFVVFGCHLHLAHGPVCYCVVLNRQGLSQQLPYHAKVLILFKVGSCNVNLDLAFPATQLQSLLVALQLDLKIMTLLAQGHPKTKIAGVIFNQPFYFPDEGLLGSARKYLQKEGLFILGVFLQVFLTELEALFLLAKLVVRPGQTEVDFGARHPPSKNLFVLLLGQKVLPAVVVEVALPHLKFLPPPQTVLQLFVEAYHFLDIPLSSFQLDGIANVEQVKGVAVHLLVLQGFHEPLRGALGKLPPPGLRISNSSEGMRVDLPLLDDDVLEEGDGLADHVFLDFPLADLQLLLSLHEFLECQK